jgi:hypothetical protein
MTCRVYLNGGGADEQSMGKKQIPLGNDNQKTAAEPKLCRLVMLSGG